MKQNEFMCKLLSRQTQLENCLGRARRALKAALYVIGVSVVVDLILIGALLCR